MRNIIIKIYLNSLVVVYSQVVAAESCSAKKPE